MKQILITSMLALGIGCGAAIAQTQPAETQSGGDANCAAGAANCHKGSKMKMGEQAQDKAKAQTDQQAQGKPKLKADEQAQGKAKVQTDQAQGKANATTDQQAQDKVKIQTNQQAQGKAKPQTNEQAQGKNSTQTDQRSTASISNVTVDQKTQITQVIKETRVEPVSNVDFDITVGVAVPRHKVRLHRLPARIVKIVPAYESYEYFLLADGRIVIVDPGSLKIVLILT
ncbi:DUF1236 domain-containing protein [Mesorhizobium sp. NZP2077]|uniref:DUF1236 domain-containing protein n=1 Tax=Mesorhizobium sp. NZP2077 TaxID=2483404 RepID=UPI001557688D|nr:DUF1236 domain-containing protein [Mesorhizobium sp. NZP2077]QKC85366.1 DUF1236 domain-containing protein [Mesorhizobium sp. NZP2077]QKD19006.1 DUF1236 domain-containing protein [Mesorhizobium sp. NZP2077]